MELRVNGAQNCHPKRRSLNAVPIELPNALLEGVRPRNNMRWMSNGQSLYT